MVIKISLWQFVPPQKDEEPGMPTYRFAGLINNKPFCADVSFEIDGRDCDYEHVWGVDAMEDQDAWEFLQEVFATLPDWNADFQKRSAEYYASCA